MRCCAGDRHEGEDVLHLAYCKVLEGRARFDGRSAFRTWLFGVIRLTALEQRRWRWLRHMRAERWREAQDVERDETTDDGEQHGRTEALRTALARLSGRQQSVLHLVFYQEMSIQEAAAVLGMPIGTARTHYERGKARLRAMLQPEAGGG